MDIWERAALWDAVMWGVAIIGTAVVLKDTPYFFGVLVSPWLAVIGLVGCIGTVAVVVRKRQS